MVEEIKSTERLIFDAALAIFQRKGLAGARMQEIADEAGINKAMLHYYFRSKELLFREVFLLSFKQFSASVIPILNESNSWEEKIPLLIHHYLSTMQKNPDLPMFIINELRYNPDEFVNIVSGNGIKDTLFIKQLKEGMEKGEIRQIQPLQVLVTVISETVFPFIARPMLKAMTSIQDAGWDTFINNREHIIEEMLISYLKKF